MIRKIVNSILKHYKPIKYAQKKGVVFPNGTEGCRLLSTEFGSEPWLIALGKHVELSDGVSFITHDGATWVFRNEQRYQNVIRYGKIIIEDNCFIGKNVTILPNVHIGRNTIIGACSVVVKDIPANSVAVGNPAKVLSSTYEFAEKCLAETPEYDVEMYKKDKKTAVLNAYSMNIKDECKKTV